MLNFRNINIVFICLLIVFIAYDVKVGIPWYVYLITFLIYSSILFYGCYYVGSHFFIKVICAAKTDRKEIAISFDDGPVASNTNDILEILAKEKVKATFFCIGHRIKGNERILQQIMDDGHVIGNHSYSHHFWFDMFSSQKMLNDLKQMDDKVARVTKLQPRLFRPPYGVTNPNLAKAIKMGNYTPVGWSVRSLDTVIKDRGKLFGRICKSIAPGAVFLFHDTSEITIQVLPDFIKEVKNRGYQIVPLDKLLHLNAYV